MTATLPRVVERLKLLLVGLMLLCLAPAILAMGFIASPRALLAVAGATLAALLLGVFGGWRFILRPLHAALRRQADLEAEVAARTRTLADTDTRLQIETAERAKTEAALHRVQTLQAVGLLAGGIAHDFNNMLATVLGSLELMERRLTSGPMRDDPDERARQQVLIERAMAAVQRGAHLTAGLLALSRRQRQNVRPTDANPMIRDLLDLAASTLGRNMHVRTDLAADLWPALVDPGQFEAAILNLCLNARDAMPGGGELLVATANAPAATRKADGPAPGDHVRVTVSDTGCGMAPDVLERAFEPFFSTRADGAGLGLSQVRALAVRSGGTVHIDSAPGDGTRVTLLLRRSPDPAPPPTRSAGRAEVP